MVALPVVGAFPSLLDGIFVGDWTAEVRSCIFVPILVAEKTRRRARKLPRRLPNALTHRTSSSIHVLKEPLESHRSVWSAW